MTPNPDPHPDPRPPVMRRHPLRRVRAALAATASIAVVLTACAPGGADPDGTTGGDEVTIGLTYTPNIQFAAFYVADDLGYFRDAGLDVTLRHHGESEELFGALEQGTEQLVYAGGDEILQARSGGVGVTSIATLYNTYPAVLIVPDDSPIRSSTDLRGHSVGVPGPYGATWFALKSLLDREGLAESDVDIETIGYTQQAALTSGKVDAVMGYVNNDAVRRIPTRRSTSPQSTSPRSRARMRGRPRARRSTRPCRSSSPATGNRSSRTTRRPGRRCSPSCRTRSCCSRRLRVPRRRTRTSSSSPTEAGLGLHSSRRRGAAPRGARE